MKKQHFLAGVAGLALFSASAAHAQSVDYGSLQQLFDEPVTTSATGSPQRSTEAPADMQIISADDIRKSGEVTIPGILQRAAGIDVLNQSAGQSDVNVRGYDQAASPRLLVLINGRQVYQDHYGETQWETLPVQLDEIRQIEVVKGPNAALFGFNAVSGVINIITYNPKYDDISVATARVGLNNERQISLVQTLKLGPAVSVRLSGGGQTLNEWKTTGTNLAQSALHNPASAEANLDAVAQLSPKTELRVEGSWNNDVGDQVSADSSFVIKTVTTSEKATLTSDTKYGLVQAFVYSNQLQLAYPSANPWYNVIDVASIQDLFKIGVNNTFRITGEFRKNTLNTSTFAGGKVGYDVFSGAGMWNWAITSQLTTTAAVRIDAMTLQRTGDFLPNSPEASNELWNRTITEPSVNLTGAWRPTGEDTFKLSYARGIQAPSLIELGGLQLAIPAGPHVTLDVVGNPNLQPTVAQNYEASYDHTFKLAKVGVRAFYQTWTALKSTLNTSVLQIYPTATTNGGFAFENASNSKETGVELTASGKMSDALTWHGDYTYTSVSDAPYAGQDQVGNQINFAETTPKYRGNIGLDWDKGPWETDLNLHYVGAVLSYALGTNALTPIKAYEALSARVGYRFEHGITVAISGQNLLAAEQRESNYLKAQTEAQFTISKAW